MALLGLIFIRKLIDFPVYYAAGQSLINGRTDLYAPDYALGRVMDYRYPPIFLLAFMPLWVLPYKIAAYVWYLLAVSQIAGGLLLLKKIAGVHQLHRTVWLFLLFSTGQYFIMILHYGNAHLLAIFCLIASSYLLWLKKDFWAAVLMALAITIKLTPALLLVYFACKKQWRYLLLVGAFLVGINLLPAGYFGFNNNLELHKTWFSHVVLNQEFHEENGPINLSLKGQLRRYFSQVDYRQRVDGDTHYPTFTSFALTSQATDTIWLLSSLILLGVVVVLTLQAREWQKSDPAAVPSGNRYLLEIGLYICLMLFIGPLTSKIYFIALLVPVFALAIQSERKAAGTLKKVLGVIAIVNSLLPLLPGRLLQRWFLVLGIDFFVNLLLMAAITYSLFLPDKSSQSSTAELPRPSP
jgi:hypothetical protein